MDGKFDQWVIQALRDLLSDIEAGLQPADVAFHEHVIGYLRKEYDRYNKQEG